MTTLSTIIKERLTALLTKYQVFFAFDQKTFDEQAIPNTEYQGLLHGGYAPKKNIRHFMDEYYALISTGIAEDIKMHGKKEIIKRELINHECYYTGDIEEIIAALMPYKITPEEIKEVYHATYSEQDF